MQQQRAVRSRTRELRVSELLERYPGLSLRPSRNGSLVIAGELAFTASTPEFEEISDAFQIELRVPADFPKWPPTVHETAGRLPARFHAHTDGSRCLASPFVQAAFVRENRSLLAFVERFVIPYLYGYLTFKRTGTMPFGELDHGHKGLLAEYRDLLGGISSDRCLKMLELAAQKRRTANKEPCPCGNGKRVGRCHHRAIERLRRRAPRSYFRSEVLYLAAKIEEQKASDAVKDLRGLRTGAAQPAAQAPRQPEPMQVGKADTLTVALRPKQIPTPPPLM